MKQNSELDEMQYLPTEEHYQTTDLGLAIALIVTGFGLMAYDKHNPQRVEFVFKREGTIEKVADQYFCDRLEVPARRYWDTAKAIKNRLRSS